MSRGTAARTPRSHFRRSQGVVCGERSIEAVQDSGLLGDRASGEVVIHDKPMPDGRLRRKWLDEALKCVEESEVHHADRGPRSPHRQAAERAGGIGQPVAQPFQTALSRLEMSVAMTTRKRREDFDIGPDRAVWTAESGLGGTVGPWH